MITMIKKKEVIITSIGLLPIIGQTIVKTNPLQTIILDIVITTTKKEIMRKHIIVEIEMKVIVIIREITKK